MDNISTTICVNGELKPGDLVVSTPEDDYPCLVGTVLSIGKAEHSERTYVNVNFMTEEYSENRLQEIEQMLGDAYGRPTTPGIWPLDIDNLPMSPDALIRITGIGGDTLRAILDSHEAAEALCKLVESGPGVSHDARNGVQEGYITEKLYSPLFCQVQDDENKEYYDGDYWSDPMSQQEAVYYEDEIRAALLRERMPDEEPRGLMTYYHEADSVDKKVHSLYVDVEVHDEKLWGVATLELTEPLTPEEFATLKDYLSGQYSDGFGEGFEQRDIKIDRGELNVSLWSYEDEFYIVTERVFRQRLGLETKQPEAPTPAQAALYEPDVLDDSKTAALSQQLTDRLDKNLSDYFDTLRNLGAKEIIGMSSEIGARMDAHYYLTEIHNFHTSELEYLLKFQNPLEVVAEEFLYAGTENRSDIMWKIFDRQDAFQGDYPLMPDPSAEAALKQKLFEQLDVNFADYCECLMNASKQEIVGMAAEITSLYAAREYLKTGYDFKTGEVEYLLRFQDPLAVIADGWPDTQGTLDGPGGISDVVSDILEDKSSHGHYARVMGADAPAAKESARDASTERRSVLEQIREAAKAPKVPRRDKPSRDRNEPEL